MAGFLADQFGFVALPIGDMGRLEHRHDFAHNCHRHHIGRTTGRLLNRLQRF